jgi:hypothetical protein
MSTPDSPSYPPPPSYSPPPSAPPPPPPAPGGGYAPAYGGPAYPGSGPLGTPRSIGVSILLGIVTLGIYTYVWTFKTHSELKAHTGQGLGGGLGLLIYFLISPVTYFLIASEVKNMYNASGQESPVSTIWGLWFLLPLIGSAIWFVKVQGALNDYWVARGAPAP